MFVDMCVYIYNRMGFKATSMDTLRRLDTLRQPDGFEIKKATQQSIHLWIQHKKSNTIGDSIQ